MSVVIGVDVLRDSIGVRIETGSPPEVVQFTLTKDNALELCEQILKHISVNREVIECPKSGMTLPPGWKVA